MGCFYSHGSDIIHPKEFLAKPSVHEFDVPPDKRRRKNIEITIILKKIGN